MPIPWSIPRMWEGGDCWIIGGGSSMPRQFGISESVIENVNSETDPVSVYSDYLSELHDKNVIGVNVAFMLGKWISVLYFCDSVFYRTYREDINNFRNLKVTCVNHMPRPIIHTTRNIKRMTRDNGPGLSNNSRKIKWNHNSGAAAINFATLAGAKRILLLGFDMIAIEDRTHWHSGFYKNPTTKTGFKRFMRGFPQIAADAKQRNIEILNVSLDSVLKDFQKVELKDVL